MVGWTRGGTWVVKGCLRGPRGSVGVCHVRHSAPFFEVQAWSGFFSGVIVFVLWNRFLLAWVNNCLSYFHYPLTVGLQEHMMESSFTWSLIGQGCQTLKSGKRLLFKFSSHSVLLVVDWSHWRPTTSSTTMLSGKRNRLVQQTFKLEMLQLGGYRRPCEYFKVLLITLAFLLLLHTRS